MSKKNLIIRAVALFILLAVMMPSFVCRVANEEKNKDVVFAINYNNASMLLSGNELDKTLDENKKIGVNTAIIGEESLNTLIASGYLTAIKYNVLCHKYDDESEDIIRKLSGNKNIHNDSYVIITKRDDCKKYLSKWINAKYNDDEFVYFKTSLNADVYVIYEEVNDAWHLGIGFIDEKIEAAHEKGLDIVLSMMLNAYSNADYVKEIEALIKKYNVKFINLKKTYKDKAADKNAGKNYKAFCRLIEENNLYLILTEEQTQLSNQKPIGYNELIKSADGRVLRGYESIDIDSKNTSATIYDKRYSQILNSVTDRNLRFVTINQLTNGTDTIAEKSEKTNISTKMAIEKLSSIGYNTKSYSTKYDYNVNRTATSAAAMLIMILMCLTILEWLFGKKLVKIEILAAVGAVLSIPFTFLAPEGIVLLYPTLFALVAPCFSITVVMVFVKNMREKLGKTAFMLASLAVAAVTLLLCATIQTALLSGLDYYLNSIIFRGIKLSLIVPIVYSVVCYGIIFSKKKEESFVSAIKRVLMADIKVYWVIIGALVCAVGAIYLIRSGNVSSISPIESFMRNTITQIMPERPRTKEFLIGWPALMLFLYYVKNTECTLMRWGLAPASSILFASVINSFCHVFTTASVIYTRVFNGFILGAIISIAVLIVNHIIVCAVKKFVQAGK